MRTTVSASRISLVVVAALVLLAGVPGRTQEAVTQSVDKYEIRIESRDPALAGLHVLKTLLAFKAVLLDEAKLSKGQHQNVCQVFLEETRLPGGCTQELVKFAGEVNKFSSAMTSLPTGTSVYYPNAKLEKYEYGKQYNLAIPRDRVELANDKATAGQYMSEHATKSRSGNFIEHTFEGYKLQLDFPSDAVAEAVIKQLNAYPGVFVVKETAAGSRPKGKSEYSAKSTTEQVPAFCTGNGTPEEPYARLIGVHDLAAKNCIGEPNGSCPEIVILDAPIARHPEIDGIEGSTGAEPTAPEALCTDPNVLGIAKFHSTHMAGIIASKQNGKAFIGLHPGGRVVQGWGEQGPIADQVYVRRNRDAMQVYLYARSWMLDPPFADGKLLKSPSFRVESIVAKRIHSLRENLWVVAAGQPNEGGLSTPTEIGSHLNLGPMNSGDQENVLVVAGCTDCGSPTPRFWNQSHFSRRFVHVAAPADMIVSTATAGSYTWAQGTSQAAAFAAGLVSAMVSAWPGTYKFASRVKERLQYTATPFPDPADREKVAAGVLNPTLALKDPNADFIDLTDPGKSLERVVVEGWCERNLTVLTPGGDPMEHGHLLTKRIRRIVLVNTPHGRQWSVFTEKPWGDPEPGIILHVGPGIPTVLTSDDAIVARPLLKAGGRIIALQQIEDLLVRSNLPKTSCP